MTPRRASPSRLLVVSQSLGGGGAERAITILLRHLDRERLRPSLALFSGGGAFLADVPPDVPVFDLEERSPYAVWRTAVRLGATIRAVRPAVILSVLKHPNLVTLALCRAFFRDVPVVISEQNELSVTVTGGRGRHLKRVLHRRLYPGARRIVAVSAGVKHALEEHFDVPASLIEVISNPCEIDRVLDLAREEPKIGIDWSVTTVVAAGRLIRQKGFGHLLEAFALVARWRPARLIILGEGEDRPALERQAAALGVADRVLMPGFQPNPFAYMARAHLFVLSSLWEGFGNVIVEAMACGTPVVSTACPSGPDEIVTDGVNGLLVPTADVGALADAMERVLGSDALARRLADAGRATAAAFAPAHVVRRYEDVLEESARG